MSTRHSSTDELEQAMERALRDLPLRPAPRTLEARVMAALDKCLTLPWWRRSFVHWPLAARAVFLVLSAGFVPVGLRLSDILVAPSVSWVRTVVDLAASFADVLHVLSFSIPKPWLYGTGALVLALYALFFGLSAFGYQALRHSRVNFRHT